MDLLREEHGVVAAGALGHSAGEIAAGYADGCLTREQTVLIAYHRGRMAPDHGVSGGLMAAVGLSAGMLSCSEGPACIGLPACCS